MTTTEKQALLISAGFSSLIDEQITIEIWNKIIKFYDTQDPVEVVTGWATNLKVEGK